MVKAIRNATIQALLIIGGIAVGMGVYYVVIEGMVLEDVLMVFIILTIPLGLVIGIMVYINSSADKEIKQKSSSNKEIVDEFFKSLPEGNY